MALTTGSGVVQANPVEYLMTQINTALIAHPNWSFVEDYTVSTTKWSVYRCGTANGLPGPYHVLFNRSTTAGTLNLYSSAAETYDATTHSYGHPCPDSQSSSFTPAADGSYGGATTYALTSNQRPNSLWAHSLLLSTGAFDYWIAVNNEGFWIGTRVGTTPGGVIVGRLDSLVSNPGTNDPFPLYISHLINPNDYTGQQYAYTSRHPMVTTSQPYLWQIYEHWRTTRWPEQAVVGSVGGTGDLFQDGKPVGARLLASIGPYVPGAPNVIGRNRGLYRHLLGFSGASGVGIGDTITVAGETYINTYTTSGPWYNTAVV